MYSLRHSSICCCVTLLYVVLNCFYTQRVRSRFAIAGASRSAALPGDRSMTYARNVEVSCTTLRLKCIARHFGPLSASSRRLPVLQNCLRLEPDNVPVNKYVYHVDIFVYRYVVGFDLRQCPIVLVFRRHLRVLSC